MFKYTLILCILFGALPIQAQLQENLQVLGILPTENITSLEIKPRFKAKNDRTNDISSTIEIKPSFKLNRHWKFGAEIPLSRIGNDTSSAKGLGDIMLSSSYVDYTPNKIFSYGLAMELTAPTATSQQLGGRKMDCRTGDFYRLEAASFFLHRGRISPYFFPLREAAAWKILMKAVIV